MAAQGSNIYSFTKLHMMISRLEMKHCQNTTRPLTQIKNFSMKLPAFSLFTCVKDLLLNASS
jgi:hypothetical protein